MRFPPDFLDEIRARVPISDVIGRRVTWDRRKTQAQRGDWWACCPFHGEKTPSFHCEDAKGRYHCFGCGVSGDHFRFLTELEGMSFPEAVERLAAEAGVSLPDRDPEAERRQEARRTALDALKIAADYFRAELQASEGARARAYLRDRGLTPRIQELFGIGYAPNSRNRLKEHLASKGISRAEIEATGLVIHGDDIPVSYDRFRDRVMFPITDVREAVIAFGGRALSADQPAKYLNSPETGLFHKGEVLFNLARARRAAREAGALVVVEGYIDVIALAQAGLEHAVAPLGTAITERQLDLMWRTAGEPVLCFDGDAAGLKAAHRAAEIALPALKPGRSLRFALLPEGKDPDDIVRDGGAEAFGEVIGAARPLADLLWMKETAGGGYDTPERRAELEQRLFGLVGRIADESVRRHYLADARERLGAFFGSSRTEGRRGRGSERRGHGGFSPSGERRSGAARRTAISEGLARSMLTRPPAAAAPALREIAIVLGFVNHPMLIDEAFEYFAELELAPGDLDHLRSSVLDAYAEAHPEDRDALIAEIRLRGTYEIFSAFEAQARRVRLWPVLAEADPSDAREAIRQALFLSRRARTLAVELRRAETALGAEGTENALEHLLEIKREIERINGTEALIEGFGVLSGRPARSI